MKSDIMHIQTFGKFSVSLGNEINLFENARNSKMLYLLQYLLLNKENPTDKDTLIKVLYDNEEIDNPGNALKLIIHRLRKMLQEAGFPQYDYILYKKGEYTWNTDIPCEIDAEIFQQILAKAAVISDTQEKILLYKKAVDLYQGDFLPKSALEEWVSVFAIRYQNMYLDCVRRLYALLADAGDYQAMLPVLDKAVKLVPYYEELHILRINCLIELKNYEKAIDMLNQVTDFFFKELGIAPTEEMKALHKKINTVIQGSTTTLPDIIDVLKEGAERPGAYYCNYFSFIEGYRILLRTTERSGLSMFLMSCYLKKSKDALDGEDVRITEAYEALQRAISASLRKGDVYTSYTKRQFLILLSGIQQEHCQMVFERIKENFKVEYAGRGIKLHYDIAPAQNMLKTMPELKFSTRGLKW